MGIDTPPQIGFHEMIVQLGLKVLSQRVSQVHVGIKGGVGWQDG